MLAYAASRPSIAARRSSPHSFLVIASAHVLAIAVVVSAKMDLPSKVWDRPLVVDTYPVPKERRTIPDPPVSDPRDVRQAAPARALPMPLPDPGFGIDSATGPVAADPPQPLPPMPLPAGETRGAVLLTPPDRLKPPYPAAMLALGEEASLTLRLSIDSQGRVTAVDPVGRADRAFLEAARRHLIAHWRYRPAMKDGQAVATTILTTLHFRLDG